MYGRSSRASVKIFKSFQAICHVGEDTKLSVFQTSDIRSKLRTNHAFGLIMWRELTSYFWLFEIHSLR